MLYAFGDETYPAGTSGREAAYLVIAVQQEAYDLRASEIEATFHKKHRGKRRQQMLVETLRQLGASIVLGRAKLPDHLDSVKAIEEPSTGRVNLRAAQWAWTCGFTCSVALLSALRFGAVFSSADFYHDPETLSGPYREYIHSTLRRVLRGQLTEYSQMIGPTPQQPVLRCIESVPKKGVPYSLKHIRRGVDCAHELLTFATKSPQEAAEFIEFKDFSRIVEGMLSGGEIVTEVSEGIPPNPAAQPDVRRTDVRRTHG